jgi:glycosyltransferase involved in cell wall biosynthesis
LRALGHEVAIAAPDFASLPGRRHFVAGDNTPLDGVIRFPAHPVLFFPEDGVTRYLSRDYFRLQRQIRDQHFDIVHTHTPFVLGILAMYWHRDRHVPLVHTFHTLLEDFIPHYFPFYYLPRRLSRGFIHWFCLNAFHWYCNHFDRVIAPSCQVAALLRGYYLQCPVEVLPTGIDVQRFQNGDGLRIRNEWQVASHEKLLLFSGRVCFEKNVGLLVQSMGHILRQEPATKLAIVGQGPAETSLRRTAQEMGIASQVLFTGYRPYAEMSDIYAAADLFLFSSQTETQGLVTTEAMASGTPVVAVHGPGTLDLLKDEIGGLLCTPEPEDLARNVIRLLRDPTLYTQKAAGARARAEDFSSLAMARRIVQIYESIL